MKTPLLIVALGILLGGCESHNIAPKTLGQRTSSARVSSENAEESANILLDADIAQAQTGYSSADVLTQSGISTLQKGNTTKASDDAASLAIGSKVNADGVALAQASHKEYQPLITEITNITSSTNP